MPLVREGAVEPAVGVFLNRLSDYLFQAARWAVSGSKQLQSCRCAPRASSCARARRPPLLCRKATQGLPSGLHTSPGVAGGQGGDHLQKGHR